MKKCVQIYEPMICTNHTGLWINHLAASSQAEKKSPEENLNIHAGTLNNADTGKRASLARAEGGNGGCFRWAARLLRESALPPSLALSLSVRVRLSVESRVPTWPATVRTPPHAHASRTSCASSSLV